MANGEKYSLTYLKSFKFACTHKMFAFNIHYLSYVDHLTEQLFISKLLFLMM